MTEERNRMGKSGKSVGETHHSESAGSLSVSRLGSGAVRGLFLVALTCIAIFLSLSSGPAPVQGRGGDDPEPYAPALFAELAQRLSHSYLDPERIEPRNLMRKALAALENAVDEIYVQSYAENPIVTVHLNSRVRGLSLSSVDDLEDAVEMLETLFQFINENYRGDLGIGDIQYAVANGFLSGLDPHTMIFSPKEFRSFSVHIEGEIYGVGMYVGTRDGKLKVIEVLKGTPAARAGFKKNDLIAKIDDESTINMTVSEGVDKIRGPRKSKVTLTVKRKDEDGKLTTIPIEVERDKVVIKSVESKLINDWDGEGVGHKESAVGYISVTNFDKNTTPSLEKHLAQLKSQNEDKPLTGLILDLRGNSGGLLRQAVMMTDLFLKRGDIVVQASRGQLVHRENADDHGEEPQYPIVLLADRASASGAEIVIGALQKNNRAVVLGTHTFGKGSVQQLHPMDHARDAQLKITVSEYLIPGNISIQENGVVPDILAKSVALSKDDQNQRYDLFPESRSLTEKDYARHLISRFAKDEDPSFTLKYLHDRSKYDPDNDPLVTGNLQPTTDKLVMIALRLLERMQSDFRRTTLLEKHRNNIEELKENLFEEIVVRLGELNVDWSHGENPTEKKVSVELSQTIIEEPSEDEEDPVPVSKLIVTARATNNSDRPLYRIRGTTKSDYYLFEDYEFLFGKIAPGETVERSARVRLPYFPYSRSDLLTVELGDDEDVFASEDIVIELKDHGRPRFSFSAKLLDAQSKQHLTTLKPGVEALLKVKVTNTGNATAHKGVVILRNETGRQVFLNKGRIEFTELHANSETEAEFSFRVRSGRPVNAYDFEIGVVDSYSGVGLAREIHVPHKAQEVNKFPAGLRFEAPEVTAAIANEEGASILVTDASSLMLNANIRSPTGVPFKYWIMHNSAHNRAELPDKIFYSDSKGKSESDWSTRVALNVGTNLFTVVAHDENGLESRHNLVVRRTD